MCRPCVVLLAVSAAAGPVVAGDPGPFRFRFQPGQTIATTARQVTAVAETTLEEGTNRPVTAMTVIKLDVSRAWAVKAVDAAGAATLELTVTAMRQQITRPGPADRDGKPTADVAVLDSATPEGRERMAAFLGKPIATVTVDPLGRVVAATGPPADRVRAELPFRLALPDAAPAAGASWGRAFAVKTATGEAVDFAQTYTLAGVTAGVATARVATAPTAPPADPAEWPQLAPYLWAGEVQFDPATGRYLGAKLTAKKEVANHRGDGTLFTYRSEFTETVSR